ncbi:hypothetical protein B0H14DRAFT_2635716 [Mycena olivaceomarginata]|nr:hypothetical protein B0H14DRAFT_2635716 [Mycena olivaceomarginata]
MKPARITHPNIAQRKKRMLDNPEGPLPVDSAHPEMRALLSHHQSRAAFSSTLEQSPTPETVDLKHQAEAQRDIQTLAECDKISQEHGARWLEMGRLPHWDPTRMLCLIEGLIADGQRLFSFFPTVRCTQTVFTLKALMFDALRGLHWDWIQDRDGPTRPVVADLFFHIMIPFSPPQSRDLPAMIMGTPFIWVACRSPVVVICIDTEGVGNFSRPAVKDIHESMVATAKRPNYSRQRSRPDEGRAEGLVNFISKVRTRASLSALNKTMP